MSANDSSTDFQFTFPFLVPHDAITFVLETLDIPIASHAALLEKQQQYTQRRVCGIYVIIDRTNCNFYIGSSVDIVSRWHGHKVDLRRQKHVNPRLQRAWVSHGEQSFTFLVLELCVPQREIVLEREQYYLDIGRAGKSALCLNILPVAGSAIGHPVSELTRQRISQAVKGKSPSPEARQKMREAKLGRSLSLEHRQRLSDVLLGKKIMRPLGIINFRLRKFSPEQVQLIRKKKAQGVSYAELAKEFGTTVGPIQRIVYRETYQDVMD